MNHRKFLIGAALAALAPLHAMAAPTIQFELPIEGGALWGNVEGPPNCIVTGSDIARVMFYINDVWTNTDGNLSNGLGCWIDTRKYADGTYTLKAVAYNGSGQTATTTRTVVIANAGAPTVSSKYPAIAFQAPAVGGVLSGNVQGPPNCVITGYNIARVMFYLNGTWTNTDGNLLNGLGCWIDTAKYADGDYTLKAVAYSSNGRTASALRAISIRNGTGSGGGDVGGLPSTNTKAIATFESLGLYWKPASNPGPSGCQVRYRQTGTTDWKPALPMWFDPRNAECRGSIVQLKPGTDYEVQFSMPGQQPAAQLAAKTWAENFPIAQVVQLSGTRTTPLNIVQGGTANGYVLYTGPATIDVGNAYDTNITIAAPYVIVRGLTLRGARVDAIRMVQGARDVVIEDNDISGWGRDSGTVSTEGWKIAVNEDSGIKAYCSTSNPWLERTVIQRNRIHHPRYGANSWSDGHPLGPNAVFFGNCGGNHVMRYNEIYSDWGRYFMDGIGGADNFSNFGVPNADSDIYGNRISQVWDDAIEAEGANRNVRIWSNYTDHTAVAIATSSTSIGPVYIFRNVQNRSRQLSQNAPDDDQQLGRAFAKSGSTSSFGGGARYVFHNTLLQAPPLPGTLYPQGAGIGLKGNANQPLTNTVSRNNVYHIWKPWLSAIDDKGGTGNSLDYDLYNGNIVAYAGAEANGIVGTPIYEAGNGWENESGGFYQLAPTSPGYDRGVYLPNFNDGFTGRAPDFGAHEAGTPGLRFGIGGGANGL